MDCLSVLELPRDRFARRMKHAAPRAAFHLLLSAIAVTCVAVVVFQGWYRYPWSDLLGVTNIFWIVVAVDLICGPLLTLVLCAPHKKRKELIIDLSMIALVQLSALSYGVWSVYQARPVVLAFEVDRFAIVTANEVQKEMLPSAPEGLGHLPIMGILQVGLRPARSSEEYLNSVDLSLRGITQSMRPAWWRSYDDSVRKSVMAKARPLGDLVKRYPEKREIILNAIQGDKLPLDEIFYLPLVSSKKTGWVIFLRGRGEIAGYAPLDGFD